MQSDGKIERFWRQYVDALPHAEEAERRFYEVFCVGGKRDAIATQGAELIKRGVKTTGSSLLWQYQAEHKPLPQVGSLSIVADGTGEPVCIVETTWVAIKRFADIDAPFAYEYGEWDRTLATWRQRCWEINTERCRRLGREPTEEMPLVCERFKVVYPAGAC